MHLLRCTFLTLVLPCLPALGSSVGPFTYTGNGYSPWLGQHAQLYVDQEGTLRLNDVVATGAFKPANGAILNLGNTGHTYWVRIPVRNGSDRDDLMLLIQYAEIEELDIHLLSGADTVRVAYAGQQRPIDVQAQPSALNCFPLPLIPGQEGTLYIRASSQKQLQLPIAISNREQFLLTRNQRNLWIGGYVGIMLVMALYNLFIFLSIRDRSYLIYFAYIAFVGLTQLSFLGVTGYYLWPQLPLLATKGSLLLTCLTAFTAGEFMKRFLYTRELMPGFDRAANICYAVLGGAVALSFLGLPLVAYNIVQGSTALFAFYQLYSAALIIRRGSRPAVFFLISWIFFLLGVMAYVMKDWGVLPFNSYTLYAMPVGSALEVVLLSFGLADKINILRREKEQSQAEALAASQLNEKMIREQNVVLEQKVNERTLELRESNDHLKRTQSQLVNAEKMASLGQLTAGIAHEINNPVNFISSNIPPLRRNLEDMLDLMLRYRSLHGTLNGPELKAIAEVERQYGVEECIAEIKEMLNSIEEGASRTSAIVRGLRNFSRLDEDDLKLADLHEGIRSTLTVLGSQLRDKADIRLDLGELPMVECHPGKLNQVVMNVLTNAVQAVSGRFLNDPTQGVVTISTYTLASEAVIAVRDNGPGMPDHVRQRIFEPFFTTKDVGEGTGLGLSIAYSIMEKHNGRIEVESMPGEGTEFRLILPIQASTAMRQRA